MKKIPNDLDAPYKQVIAECTYAAAYKVAWESRRFWEQDYNIYGGLEFVNTGCSPIWFPSAGMFSDRGVCRQRLHGRSHQRVRQAQCAGEVSPKAASRSSGCNPGHGKELEKPVYVGWGKVPYNEGSWIRSYGSGPTAPERATLRRRSPAPGARRSNLPAWRSNRTTGAGIAPTAARTESNPGYDTLIQPDGRIIFIGDHVSHIVAWQEGAAVSALRGVQLLSEQVKAAKLAFYQTRRRCGITENTHDEEGDCDASIRESLSCGCRRAFDGWGSEGADDGQAHPDRQVAPSPPACGPGDTFYLSGQLADPGDPPRTRPRGTAADYGDTKTQAASIFAKIQKALQAQGLDMKDVVKMTVFLGPDPKTGKLEFQLMQGEYVKYFGTKGPAEQARARSAFQVAALVAPWAALEN